MDGSNELGSVRVLVCAATLMEVRVSWPRDKALTLSGDGNLARCGPVAWLVSGVGMAPTLLRLPPVLAALRPELVLNIGIAGAYSRSGLSIGDVVMARSDVFADVGFELPEEPGFRPISQSSLNEPIYSKPVSFHMDSGFFHMPTAYRFKIGDGCTVNTCTGTDATGRLRESLFEADFETMEGAAVALVCKEAAIPVSAIRAISNFAARRDMRPEHVELALSNLGRYLAACDGWKERQLANDGGDFSLS